MGCLGPGLVQQLACSQSRPLHLVQRQERLLSLRSLFLDIFVSPCLPSFICGLYATTDNLRLQEQSCMLTVFGESTQAVFQVTHASSKVITKFPR